MKIIVAIATKGDRPKQLTRAVASLMNQTRPATQVKIYNNVLNPDYTDNAKFYYLQFYKEPIYYLTCDDDIVYPPHYIELLINYIEHYGAICTFHGRVLKKHVAKYYSGHDVYDFRLRQDKALVVDVGGTGVMGFRTDYFNPTEIYKTPYQCMSDLVFSLEAHQNQKSIICCRRPDNWLTQQEVEDSIMKQHHSSKQEKQIELANRIKEYVYCRA